MDVDFDEDWNEISPECIDLITRLLMKDPMERITLEDALKHSWFKSLDVNSTTGTLMNKFAAKKLKNKKNMEIIETCN